MTLTLVLLLSLLIGVSLGLLGGGGSILTVPILVYVAGQDAKTAIATSLLVVGVTSAAGAISHARAGRVRWRTGLVFGVAGMVGAYAGGRAAAHIAGTVLLIAFAAMMIVTAAAMLRGRRQQLPHRTADGTLQVGRIVVEGLVVGAVTGLVGAGGGFLVVPALALLGGLPMATAVGTSLVVIALKSGAGLLGYLASTPIDWALAGGVTAAAVAGSVVGGRLAGLVPEDRLRRGFGWFVLVMAVVVLLQEAPTGLIATVAGSPLTWLLVTALALAGGGWLARRRRRAQTAGPPSGRDGPHPAARPDEALRSSTAAHHEDLDYLTHPTTARQEPRPW